MKRAAELHRNDRVQVPNIGPATVVECDPRPREGGTWLTLTCSGKTFARWFEDHGPLLELVE